jgi:hypothetical protein
MAQSQGQVIAEQYRRGEGEWFTRWRGGMINHLKHLESTMADVTSDTVTDSPPARGGDT